MLLRQSARRRSTLWFHRVGLTITSMALRPSMGVRPGVCSDLASISARSVGRYGRWRQISSDPRCFRCSMLEFKSALPRIDYHRLLALADFGSHQRLQSSTSAEACVCTNDIALHAQPSGLKRLPPSLGKAHRTWLAIGCST